MRILPISILMLASPVVAAQAGAIGKETVITQASNGSLREWQAGPAKSGILYVRDRNERWYQVTLTGPCTTDMALDTLSYTTDPNGTFDRFSRIRVARYPNQTCGIRSIRTSLPPKGRPGAPKG